MIEDIKISQVLEQDRLERKEPVSLSQKREGIRTEWQVPGLEWLTRKEPPPMSAAERKSICAQFKMSQELLARWG